MTFNPATLDIASLPSLPLSERKKLPRCGGVYFVQAGRELLYIGRAENLRKRWASHHRLLEFEQYKTLSISWLVAIDRATQIEIEQKTSLAFCPRLNGKKPILVKVQEMAHRSLRKEPRASAVTFAVTPTMRRKLEILAREWGCSVSFFVGRVLEKELEKEVA